MMNEFNEKNLEDVQRLKEDVYKSWWRDGMFEISFGIAMFFIGLGYFIPKIPFLPNTFLSFFLSRLIPILIGVFGFFWLSRKFKEKYIWGKAGYSVPSNACPLSVKISILAGFLFYILAMLSRRFLSSEAIILLTGTAIIFAYLALYFQSGKAKRFLVFSILTIIIAGINALMGIFYPQAIYLMIFIIGCFSLISGNIVYRAFRRRYNE
jgi:hypothetical protein